MARRKNISEETDMKVSEEIVNEEPRRERRRRVSKIIDESVEETPKTINKADIYVKSYIVKCDILNVRLGPGYGFRVEKQLLKGQTVNISKIDNEFGEIEPGLWVAMKFLE